MKVLIHGTGFAGQGHADAFRSTGAEVVGIVGRSPDIVKEVAEQKNIPYSGTNWLDALNTCKPDIVSIGTPGGAHYDPIKQAIEHGCHVFCDKPMTDRGESAVELFELASSANVKTAYAISFRYTSAILHARQLVEQGAIGEPLEVECISHFNLEKEIPFGWSHRKEEGGGRLNNNFTHTLSCVSSVIAGKITRVVGEVRDDLGKAPIVDGVHNFTTRRNFIPKNLTDPSLQWGESNVEWSYTVMAQLKSQLSAKPVSVFFKHGGLVPRYHDDHIIFYGSKGAIYLKGHYGSGQLSFYGEDKQWKDLSTPGDIAKTIPDVSGDTEKCWHYLAREFVRDIRGEAVPPYPTFKEGCQYQQLIDIIRNNDNWTDVSHLN